MFEKGNQELYLSRIHDAEFVQTFLDLLHDADGVLPIAKSIISKCLTYRLCPSVLPLPVP